MSKAKLKRAFFLLSSASLVFLTDCKEISVSAELIRPHMRYTFSLSRSKFHTLPPVTFCTSPSHTPLSSSSVLRATRFVIKNPGDAPRVQLREPANDLRAITHAVRVEIPALYGICLFCRQIESLPERNQSVKACI